MKWIDYLLLAGVVVGACLILSNLPARPIHATTLIVPAIPVVPSGTAKLVAVTPDGTKVYRVEGPEMIVPAVLAVSPNGQVAFR